MRTCRFRHKLIASMRNGLVSCAAMAFLVAALGVPLPSGPAKDRSIPFPCMDRACGCHDAAGCKEHCCCFTSDEKLAWAATHQVDPKPFVDDRALAALPAEGCHAQELEPCRHTALAACCAEKATTGQSAAAQSVRQHGTDQPGELLSIAAYRQCTGLAPLWTLLGAALPAEQPLGYEFQWLVTGQVASRDCTLTFLSFSPPTPPPRA